MAKCEVCDQDMTKADSCVEEVPGWCPPGSGRVRYGHEVYDDPDDGWGEDWDEDDGWLDAPAVRWSARRPPAPRTVATFPVTSGRGVATATSPWGHGITRAATWNGGVHARDRRSAVVAAMTTRWTGDAASTLPLPRQQ